MKCKECKKSEAIIILPKNKTATLCFKCLNKLDALQKETAEVKDGS